MGTNLPPLEISDSIEYTDNSISENEVPRNSTDPKVSGRYVEVARGGDSQSPEYTASREAREAGELDPHEKEWATQGVQNEDAVILAAYEQRIAQSESLSETLALISERESFKINADIQADDIDKYINAKYAEEKMEQAFARLASPEELEHLDSTINMAELLSPESMEALQALSDKTSVMDIGFIGNLLTAFGSGPREAWVYNSIVQALFPEDADDIGFLGRFSANKARNIISKRFLEASDTQKQVIAQGMVSLLEDPKNRDFWINDLEKWGVLEEFLAGETVDPNSVSRAITDVITGLDLLFVGQLLKIPVRGAAATGRSGRHVASDLTVEAQVNPAKATDDTAKALNSDEAAAAKGAGSSQEVGEAHLPVAEVLDDGINELPEATQLAIQQSNEELAALSGKGEYVLVQNHSMDEINAVAQRATDDLLVHRGTLILGGAQKIVDFNMETGAVTYKTYIGAHKAGGTFTKGKAESIVNRLAKDDVDARIFEKPGTPGRYLVEVTVNDVVGKNFLEETAVKLNPLSKFSNFLESSSSMLAPFVQRMRTLAVLKGSAKEQTVQKMILPYTKLSKSSRQKVDDLLIKGDKDEEVFMVRDLIGDYTPEEIAGYLSYRNLMRADLAGKEADLYQKFMSEGFNRFASVGGKNMPLRQVDNYGGLKTDKVFDSASGKFIDAPDVAKLPKGTILVELPDWLEEAGDVTRYALVKHKDTMTLPQTGLMPARKGYLPVEYKGNYWIRQSITKQTASGTVTVMKPIQVFKTKREAKAALEALHAEGKYLNLSVKDIDLAKELKEGATAPNVFDLEDSYFAQRSHFSKKTDASLLSTPSEVLERVVSNKIPGYSINITVRNMKERFMKRYEGNIHPDTRGFPNEANLVEGPLGGPSLAEARVAWKQIQLYATTATNSDRAMRRAYLKMADWMENVPGGQYMDDMFSSAAQTNKYTVGNLTKRVAFTTQIALNPFAQFFIQGSHLLFASGLDPAAAQKAFRTGYAIAFQGEAAEKVTAQAIKISGYSQAEYNVLKNLYDKAGLGVISNAVQVDDISDRMFKMAATKPVHQGIHVLQRLGFENGERLNRANMLVFAAERYAKESGKKLTQLTEKELSDIAAKSLDYGFNMTRADTYAYQRGLLSAATQYWSVRHKAVQTVFGRNRSLNLTGKERARLAAGQLAWFGSEGLGVGYMVNQMIEASGLNPEDEDLRHAIHGGLTDLLINQMIQSTTGGDPSISVASRISPMSDMDYSIMALMHLPFADDRGTILEDFMGASYSPWSKFFQVGTEVGRIYELGDTNSEENVMNALKVASEIVPSIGNVMSKTIIERGLHYKINRQSGNKTFLTVEEYRAKQIFGVQSYAERANRLSYEREKSIKEASDDAAKPYYLAFNRAVLDGDFERANSIYRAAVVTFEDDELARTRFENMMTSVDNDDLHERAKKLQSLVFKSADETDMNWFHQWVQDNRANPKLDYIRSEMEAWAKVKEDEK